MGTYIFKSPPKNDKYMITLFGNVASGTACLLNMTVKQRCVLSCYFSKESVPGCHVTPGSYELHNDLHFGVVERAAICIVGTY